MAEQKVDPMAGEWAGMKVVQKAAPTVELKVEKMVGLMAA